MPAGYGIAVCGGAFRPTASFFPVDKRLQSDRNESLRRDLAFGKAINRDAVSRVAGLRAGGIGQRTDRGVEMLAV